MKHGSNEVGSTEEEDLHGDELGTACNETMGLIVDRMEDDFCEFCYLMTLMHHIVNMVCHVEEMTPEQVVSILLRGNHRVN